MSERPASLRDMKERTRVLLSLELLGQDLRTGSRGVVAQQVCNRHAHAPKGLGGDVLAVYMCVGI